MADILYQAGVPPRSLHHAGMALLQHYGFRSWFVDVTDNPEIAAWFATRRYVDEVAFGKDRNCQGGSEASTALIDHTFASFRKASFLPNGKNGVGFLYVLAIDPEDSNLLVDLREHVPPDLAPRIHFQEALALFEPPDGRTINDLVAAKVEVSDSFLNRGSGTKALFPRPMQDPTYAALVKAPRVLASDDAVSGSFFAFPLLDVPWYIDAQQEASDYLPYLRVVISESLFAHRGHLFSFDFFNEVSGVQYGFQDASCIQLPVRHRAEEHLFGPENKAHSAPVEFSKDEWLVATKRLVVEVSSSLNVWPSQNIFLERPVARSLSSRLMMTSEPVLDEVVRGLWVIWNGQQVAITQILDAQGSVEAQAGCHFLLSPKGVQIARTPEDCHLDDDDVHLAQLWEFLHLTRQLKTPNVVRLHEAGDRVYHWYWRDNDETQMESA